MTASMEEASEFGDSVLFQGQAIVVTLLGSAFISRLLALYTGPALSHWLLPSGITG